MWGQGPRAMENECHQHIRSHALVKIAFWSNVGLKRKISLMNFLPYAQEEDFLI